MDSIDEEKYQQLLEDINELNEIQQNLLDCVNNQSQKIIIPFYFSFCKHYQNSIPLCALIHQEVRFKIFFKHQVFLFVDCLYTHH